MRGLLADAGISILSGIKHHHVLQWLGPKRISDAAHLAGDEISPGLVAYHFRKEAGNDQAGEEAPLRAFDLWKLCGGMWQWLITQTMRSLSQDRTLREGLLALVMPFHDLPELERIGMERWFVAALATADDDTPTAKTLRILDDAWADAPSGRSLPDAWQPGLVALRNTLAERMRFGPYRGPREAVEYVFRWWLWASSERRTPEQEPMGPASTRERILRAAFVAVATAAVEDLFCVLTPKIISGRALELLEDPVRTTGSALRPSPALVRHHFAREGTARTFSVESFLEVIWQRVQGQGITTAWQPTRGALFDEAFGPVIPGQGLLPSDDVIHRLGLLHCLSADECGYGRLVGVDLPSEEHPGPVLLDGYRPWLDELWLSDPIRDVFELILMGYATTRRYRTDVEEDAVADLAVLARTAWSLPEGDPGPEGERRMSLLRWAIENGASASLLHADDTGER